MNLTWDTVAPYRAASSMSSSRSTTEGTAGNDTSSFFNSHDDSESSLPISKHWIRVSRLESCTTDITLKKMFYPYGADEAYTFWESGSLSGFVGFEMEEMALLAADKMNSFIPCHQTQALIVCKSSLEEVIVTRARAAVALPPTSAVAPTPKSLLSALYSDCTEREVAHLIERSRNLTACADDVVTEIARSSVSILKRIMNCLTELSPNWAGAAEFREELLKHLLRTLLEGTGRCSLQATNCGVAIGNLFAMRILSGDPFQLATRLLQRGVANVAQADGICMIAHVCGTMSFPISKASFWALVGQTAAQMPVGSALTTTLLGHLRQLSVLHPPQSPLLQQPQPLRRVGDVTPDSSPEQQQRAGRFTPQSPLEVAAEHQQEEAKHRTVYVSHLPTTMPQRALMDLLVTAGPVNKVRVCVGSGYTTLFAFVEMQTTEGARAATRLNGTVLLGFSVRVQPARNPVQDVLCEDAVYSSTGSLLHPCTFGAKLGPLSQCLSPSPHKSHQ